VLDNSLSGAGIIEKPGVYRMAGISQVRCVAHDRGSFPEKTGVKR
jgi:hypothetical protein